MKLINNDFKNYHRVVIKIGSSLLISKQKIRKKWLRIFADNISELRKNKIEIIIVTSGAVALGRSILKLSKQKLSLQEKQACAAVGQIELMSCYQKNFKKLNFDVAQILLTASDCNSRDRYLNCKNTIETLLKNQAIPVINENDSVAVDEIKIGDNDRLAARVAQMISADLMILFSDIDGLYNKNPKIFKDAKFISEIKKITKEIEDMAQGSVSMVGTGGMITKIMASKMATASGCNSIITSGIENNALKNLFFSEKKFTIFSVEKNEVKNSKHISRARKNWLSGFVNAKGEIIINQKACETICTKRVSLLAIGVVEVRGNFTKGDGIFIKDEHGNHIASGIINHSDDDVKRIIGKKSSDVKKILGNSVKTEIVDVDNLILIS